jgi:nucleotide-binding universal stress UspA family protein
MIPQTIPCSHDGSRIHRRSRTGVETCTAADDPVRKGTDSDLVVVGRRRTFPWVLAPLGRYARRLLRRTRTPVLVVGSRPMESYRNVLIATDLETDVAPALSWARHIAPQASFTLLHVYRGLFESKLQYAGVAEADILEHRLAAQRKAFSGMTRLLNRHRSINRALLAHGSAVHDVLRTSRELAADLIVVVKSTHSWWAEVLGASVSVEIATRADRDVLVVHGERSRTFGVPFGSG